MFWPLFLHYFYRYFCVLIFKVTFFWSDLISWLIVNKRYGLAAWFWSDHLFQGWSSYWIPWTKCLSSEGILLSQVWEIIKIIQRSKWWSSFNNWIAAHWGIRCDWTSVDLLNGWEIVIILSWNSFNNLSSSNNRRWLHCCMAGNFYLRSSYYIVNSRSNVHHFVFSIEIHSNSIIRLHEFFQLFL